MRHFARVIEIRIRDVRNPKEQTHKITRNFTSHMVIWDSVDKVSSFRKTFNFQANMMKMTKSVFNIKTTEIWVNKQAERKFGPLPCEHVVCCLETSANAIDCLIDFTFFFSTFHNSTSLSRVALKRINSKESKQIEDTHTKFRKEKSISFLIIPAARCACCCVC